MNIFDRINTLLADLATKGNYSRTKRDLLRSQKDATLMQLRLTRDLESQTNRAERFRKDFYNARHLLEGTTEGRYTLPDATFLGVRRKGTLARKEALNWEEVELPGTGLSIKKTGPEYRIFKRNGTTAVAALRPASQNPIVTLP